LGVTVMRQRQNIFQMLLTRFQLSFFLLFFILSASTPLLAATDKPATPRINYGPSRTSTTILASRTALEEYVELQANRYDIPYLLVMAIMTEDSNINAWKVTIGKHEYFAQSKEEALFILENNPGRDYNIGIMQIHSRWLHQWGITPADAIEPHINIQLALYILNESFHAHGGLSGMGVVEYRGQQGFSDGQWYAKHIQERFSILRQQRVLKDKKPRHYEMFEKRKN